MALSLRAALLAPSRRTCLRTRLLFRSSAASGSAPDAAGFERRQAESAAAAVPAGPRPPKGGDAPPQGKWAWTLNWDSVYADEETGATLTVGSCPMSGADVQRIAREAGGVRAIVR